MPACDMDILLHGPSFGVRYVIFEAIMRLA